MSSPMVSVREQVREQRSAEAAPGPLGDGLVILVDGNEPDLLARGIVWSLLLAAPFWVALGVVGWWLAT
jgi:hypothetical protein